MANFSKLLLAIDLSPTSELLLERVRTLCINELDRLHIVHVLSQGLYDKELQESTSRSDPRARRLMDHAWLEVRKMLQSAGFEIPDDRIFLVYGEPAFEIKRLAEEITADLVIVGSHAKEDDWMQLPGATTNCVMQGGKADVMALKV